MGHRRDWQKTDPDLRIHPRFRTLCRELGAKPYEVDGWLSGIWRTAFSQAEDGDLSRFGIAGIAAMAEYPGPLEDEDFVRALLAHNFLEGGFSEDEAGNPVVAVRIHGWEEWGGALFAERNKWARKKAEERAQMSQGQPETPKGSPRESARPSREIEREKESKTLRSKALRDFGPDFGPWWDAYGNKKDRSDALELYVYWREQGASREDLLIAAKNYRASDARFPEYQKLARTFLAKKPNRWEEWVKPEAPVAVTKSDLTSADRVPTCSVCGQEVTAEDQATTAMWTEKRGWVHAGCGDRPKEAT